MKTLMNLLKTATSNAMGTNDYREYKNKLFTVCKDALLKFKPLDTGESASSPIQVLDFFSGAGGTSLGFAAINRIFPVFRFLGGCDINPISAATYSKNFGTPVVCEDIIKISESFPKYPGIFKSS